MAEREEIRADDRVAVQQFAQFGLLLELGYALGPAGRRCTCGGPVWIREVHRRLEVHRCGWCDWQQDYWTG